MLVLFINIWTRPTEVSPAAGFWLWSTSGWVFWWWKSKVPTLSPDPEREQDMKECQRWKHKLTQTLKAPDLIRMRISDFEQLKGQKWPMNIKRGGERKALQMIWSSWKRGGKSILFFFCTIPFLLVASCETASCSTSRGWGIPAVYFYSHCLKPLCKPFSGKADFKYKLTMPPLSHELLRRKGEKRCGYFRIWKRKSKSQEVQRPSAD